MAKKSFKSGDRVATFIDGWGGADTTSTKVIFKDDCSPEYGTVAGAGLRDKYDITWDEDYMNRVVPTIDGSKLLSEKDMKAKYSALELEFRKTEKEVTAKLKEASKIIREANKMSKKFGVELANMSGVYSTLYRAMDEAGWHSSSFGC